MLSKHQIILPPALFKYVPGSLQCLAFDLLGQCLPDCRTNYFLILSVGENAEILKPTLSNHIITVSQFTINYKHQDVQPLQSLLKKN